MIQTRFIDFERGLVPSWRRLSPRLRLALRQSGRRPFPRLDPTRHLFLKRLPSDGNPPWWVSVMHRPERFGPRRPSLVYTHPEERKGQQPA